MVAGKRKPIRIRWSDEEREALIAKMVEIRKLGLRLTDREVFRQAYRLEIPRDRQIDNPDRINHFKYKALVGEMYDRIAAGAEPAEAPATGEAPEPVEAPRRSMVVRWTRDEIRAIVDEMMRIKWRPEGQAMAVDRKLLILAMNVALPPERRRNLNSIGLRHIQHILDACWEALRASEPPEPEPAAQPFHTPRRILGGEPAYPYAAEVNGHAHEEAEVRPRPSAQQPRDLAHALVDGIFDRQGEVEELRAEMVEMRELVDRTSRQVGEFYGLLTRILGDLASYSAPSPQPPPVAKEEPVVGATIVYHDDRDERPRRAKIGVVGMPESFANEVRTRLGNRNNGVVLKFTDASKQLSMNMFADYDVVFLTRHVSHHHIVAARAVLGRERVVSLTTSGIVAITDAILRFLARFDDNSRAARAAVAR